MTATATRLDLRRAAGHLRRLAGLARPFRRSFALAMALGLAVGAVGVAVPYVTKLLIDVVYPRRDPSLLNLLVVALVALSGGTALAGALRGYFMEHVKTRLGHALRLLFFNHLQHLPMRFFESHRVGEVSSRFQGVGRGVDALSRIAEQAFVNGVFLLLVPPLLVWMEPRLALLTFAVVPLVSAVTAVSSRRLRHLWQDASVAGAELDAYQVEVLTRIRTFKGMGLERRVWTDARQRMRRAAETHLLAARTAQRFNAASSLLRALGLAAITWYGWTMILAGRLTLGGFVAFVSYVGYLYSPLFMLVHLYSALQESAVHLGRMFEYLDQEPEQDPARVMEEPREVAPAVRGDFALAGVGFAYAPGKPVLSGVDLVLPAGSVTAVVGASGCGKTTLLRLLAGFDPPGAGRLTLDGRPLADWPLALLRRRVSVVWQEAGLVRGSLLDNLTLGCRRPPSRSAVERAVEECGLRAVVAALPDGLDTEVAEAGASLSAGQQQRVALARALLRESPVLLLDEATANVDLETERSVLGRLLERSRAAGRTLVFVTHRLATAALADRVVMLDGGRVVGAGPHAELYTGCAAYRRLHGEESEAAPAVAAARPVAVGEER
ncbi:MAG TPA: peptidase domain-containing ABC transporter [Thermoanaerobaculia bacterium]|nr:peptidase domain-containing ABC transporter [Thermoanaerobaculia bacterium]